MRIAVGNKIGNRALASTRKLSLVSVRHTGLSVSRGGYGTLVDQGKRTVAGT